jgi:hypothetical protein
MFKLPGIEETKRHFTESPECIFQIIILVLEKKPFASGEHTVMSDLLSGVKITLWTLSLRLKVFTSLPVFTSQMIAELSELPVAINFPSGEKATELITEECPMGIFKSIFVLCPETFLNKKNNSRKIIRCLYIFKYEYLRVKDRKLKMHSCDLANG